MVDQTAAISRDTVSAHSERVNELLLRSTPGSLPEWLQTGLRGIDSYYPPLRALEPFRNQIRQFLNSGNDPFEIFVVGEGKHGKSSLVNALCGTDVATVHTLPQTNCFHRFRVARDAGELRTAIVYAKLQDARTSLMNA